MSAASKFIRFGTHLFRAPKPTPSPSPPSLLSLKPFAASQSLLFTKHRYFSAASAAVSYNDTVTDAITEAPVYHPWPEWVAFIDELKTKGYFIKPPEDSDRFYTDMNQLKDACLSFARDRFDVFKSLSMEDIQSLVEGGCPNLLRKAVNSGKRLRFYVKLDEGDVCGGCNLRGSCDRAYVVLQESEAAARTVDIVRILMFYALDPLVIDGANKPPGRELVETSARKLLSKLLQLSETAVDPSLPKPAVNALRTEKLPVSFRDNVPSKSAEMKRGDWMCPKCNFMNFAKNKRCLECKEDGPRNVDGGGVEMKLGDWACSKCNFINFARNTSCLECNAQRPKRINADTVEMKRGDWNCTECNFMNFARNIRCLECNAEGPKRINADNIEVKRGDWNCKCGFMNFASKSKCLRCQDARPKKNPNDWDCPSCEFLNYGRNTECLKCKCQRPRKETPEYEEDLWRRPH